ncbi:MAG: DUF3592 domain-containing protein [Rhodanobacteraceae bacterium]|nr:DUF3592 domain-containing protein [Rhodanobacteraceae bacterium]
MTGAIRRLLLPVLALLIGVLALAYSVLLYHESRQIERHGLLAPVQTITNSKLLKRSNDQVTFLADVSFTTQDGRKINARAPISDTALEAFHNGRATLVSYLPDRPQVMRIAGEEDAGSSWLLILVGCSALAYGSFGIARMQRGGARRSG